MVLIYFPYRIWKERFLCTCCWYSHPGRDSEYRWNSFEFMTFPSPEMSQWQYLTNDLGDDRFMFESIPLFYGGVYLKVLKTYVNRNRLIVTPCQAHIISVFRYKPQSSLDSVVPEKLFLKHTEQWTMLTHICRILHRLFVVTIMESQALRPFLFWVPLV